MNIFDKFKSRKEDNKIVNIVINRLNTNVDEPFYAHEKGTSGFDLIGRELTALYCGTDDISKDISKRMYTDVESGDIVFKLEAFERALVKTWQKFVIPNGYEIQIRPKSGVTLKTGIFVQLGTVDANYHGDMSISLYNSNNCDVFIPLNSKLAQGVLCKVERASFNTIDEKFFNELIAQSERGENGFGSTGIKN